MCARASKHHRQTDTESKGRGCCDDLLARYARALGHPHRVSILRHLKERAECMCGEIVGILPVAQSTTSQHLKKLKEAGWIAGEVEGPCTCYCVSPQAFEQFCTMVHELSGSESGKETTEQPQERSATMDSPDGIRTVVRERYGRAAETGSLSTDNCCCGSVPADRIAEKIGYRPEDLAGIPEGSNLGLGCGNPIEHAHIQPGETVLDLGSGAGFDCFLAARAGAGRVIGVDMTPQMIDKSRANAKSAGFNQVEFRLGEIEHLPLPDGSVDVIISNCVINLSPDKPQVFREALRVLKPGGRMLVSDLVLRKPLPDALKNSVEAYVGCIAGASMKDDYLSFVREAGFRQVEIVDERTYDVGSDCCGALRDEALQTVASVKVRAVKPV